MQPNTRPYCMVFGWPSPWAYNAWRCVGDSNLAISQINGDFDAKDPKMAAYRNAVLKMSARFEELEFHHVARESNQAADVLAHIGTKRD